MHSQSYRFNINSKPLEYVQFTVSENSLETGKYVDERKKKGKN